MEFLQVEHSVLQDDMVGLDMIRRGSVKEAVGSGNVLYVEGPLKRRSVVGMFYT